MRPLFPQCFSFVVTLFWQLPFFAKNFKFSFFSLLFGDLILTWYREGLVPCLIRVGEVCWSYLAFCPIKSLVISGISGLLTTAYVTYLFSHCIRLLSRFSFQIQDYHVAILADIFEYQIFVICKLYKAWLLNKLKHWMIGYSAAWKTWKARN